MKLSDSQLFMAANNIVARWVDPQLPEDNYNELCEKAITLVQVLASKIHEDSQAIDDVDIEQAIEEVYRNSPSEPISHTLLAKNIMYYHKVGQTLAPIYIQKAESMGLIIKVNEGIKKLYYLRKTVEKVNDFMNSARSGYAGFKEKQFCDFAYKHGVKDSKEQKRLLKIATDTGIISGDSYYYKYIGLSA